MKVELRDVTKSYGDTTALAGVTTAFDAGVTVLLGRNGAGKSTLCNIIAGLVPPDNGRVAVDGRLFSRTNGPVGFAPQTLAVYPTLTVEENLRVFASLQGWTRTRVEQRIRDVCELLAIGDTLRRPARTLSGGQQRCVHTAVALVIDRPVVLLDEPTVGVDVEHRQQLLDVVNGLADQGRTVLYTTHYLGELDALSPGQVVVLDAGTVRFDGTVDELVGAAGGSRLVLHFAAETAAPEHFPYPVTVSDQRWDVQVDEPECAVTAVLAALGERTSDLLQVELRTDRIEDAFIRLVGSPGGAERTEVTHVHAS